MKFDKFLRSFIFLIILVMGKAFSMNPELHVWKNVDDVRKFCAYVEEHGEDDPSIDTSVVKTTIATINNDNDKLPVLTKAMYSVSIIPISNEASQLVTELVNSRSGLSFKNLSDNKEVIIPDTPKMFNVKLAWLLWCSQTVDYKGVLLLKNAESFPIQIAKEILEKQQNGAKPLAKSIYEIINHYTKL